MDGTAYLANKPEITELTSRFYRYFIDLSNSRTNNGFGMNPISLMEIETYIRLFPTCTILVGKRDFIRLIQVMDRQAMSDYIANKEETKKDG